MIYSSYLTELVLASASASFTILSSGILGIIGWCLIYYKIGEAAYIPVIPFYNSYYQFKKFWNSGKFWLMLVLSLFLIILAITAGIGMVTENEMMFLVSLLLVSIIILILCILSIILKWKQAKVLSPNNSFLVFLGFILIAPLFTFIYGIIYKDKVHIQNMNQNNQNNQNWNN